MIASLGVLGFDTETTGINPQTDRIVTATVVHVRADGTVTRQQSWLIDPGIDIPEQATRVHGITTAKARAEGAQPAAALQGIRAWIEHSSKKGIPVVAFNAQFDCTILQAELARHGLPAFPDGCHIFDPLVVDRELDKYRKGPRTLLDVAAHYEVQLSADDAHTADADALAAALISLKILGKFKRLADVTWPELMESQAAWFDEQAVSREEYLRKTKPDAKCSRGWPFQVAEVLA